MDKRDNLQELYNHAFSRLTASPEKIQEVIEMTENKKHRNTARRLLVALAVSALLVVAAMGANAASGGEIGELFIRIVSTTSYETPDGHVEETVIEVEDGNEGEMTAREFAVYQEGEDGKVYLTYTDENGNEVKQEIDLESAAPLEVQDDTSNTDG